VIARGPVQRLGQSAPPSTGRISIDPSV
jgi:hypothetical protein